MALLLVHKQKLVVLARKLLVFKLGDAVLGHFCLDVATFALGLKTVSFKCIDKVFDVLSVDGLPVELAGLSIELGAA